MPRCLPALDSKKVTGRCLKSQDLGPCTFKRNLRPQDQHCSLNLCLVGKNVVKHAGNSWIYPMYKYKHPKSVVLFHGHGMLKFSNTLKKARCHFFAGARSNKNKQWSWPHLEVAKAGNSPWPEIQDGAAEQLCFFCLAIAKLWQVLSLGGFSDTQWLLWTEKKWLNCWQSYYYILLRLWWLFAWRVCWPEWPHSYPWGSGRPGSSGNLRPSKCPP